MPDFEQGQNYSNRTKDLENVRRCPTPDAVRGTTLNDISNFRKPRTPCPQIDYHLPGPEIMFAERDKHYPSRSGQTSLATVVTNITKTFYKE